MNQDYKIILTPPTTLSCILMFEVFTFVSSKYRLDLQNVGDICLTNEPTVAQGKVVSHKTQKMNRIK